MKEKLEKLKKDVPAVFLAMRKKETPWYAKLFAALTVAYALSPIDLIPDFVPVLGYLDDLLIVPLLVTLTVKCIPYSVWEQCRTESADMWKDGKPKKWYYAVPIVIFWLIIIWLIVKAIFF
ncbi:MAG TPA: hypothetical protein DCY31_05280 [Ruminococcaceae bacterium]|mgnify:FL=1|nr:hypothetical protein [Oscillospiraceae bacterium]HAY73251.1 hypothetical protein [Oscillospiraceae bacterium]